jgi:hypothetical protein
MCFGRDKEQVLPASEAEFLLSGGCAVFLFLSRSTANMATSKPSIATMNTLSKSRP